jgi:uncharacterized membrane protein YfcA
MHFTMTVMTILSPDSPLFLAMVVVLAAAMQSLFGLGVLFLGTPLLLLLGYPMMSLLSLLLPISLSISLLQIARGWKQVQWTLVWKFVLFALPSAALGSFLLRSITVWSMLPVCIAAYLLFVAIGFYFNAFPKLVARWTRNQALYLFATGLLHGLTNLGGPLLSSFVVTKYPNKHQSRATIAMCYGLLVSVQCISLYPSLIAVSTSNTTLFSLIALALSVYFLFDKWVFQRLSNEKFKQIFGPIVVLMSALLLLRAWL